MADAKPAEKSNFRKVTRMGNQEPQKSGKRKGGIFWLIILTLLLGVMGHVWFTKICHTEIPYWHISNLTKKYRQLILMNLLNIWTKTGKLNFLKALAINSKGHQEEDF